MLETNTLIYGFHSVSSFLRRRPECVERLILDAQRHDLRMQEILDLAKKERIPVQRASKRDMTARATHEHHQGMIALVHPQPMPADLETFLEGLVSPFLLVLDGVQDPHNLGACLRTANAAGVDAVIAPKDRAASMTPIVAKVASGATLYTPFFQVTNLARTLMMLKSRRIWLYGASEHATQLYSEVALTGALAIVMGAEGTGLRRLTKEHCDFLIRVPMLGAVASLNVSVATGVCLFEVVRQNSNKKE